MRTAPLQLRPTGARRPARALARKLVQGKAPGTRRTDGTLEQQAELAADQAVRRLPNVSRGLTEAPPASYDAPASAGRGLGEALQLDLEDTFGADLAAVRVHDDAAAHSAAQREEAQAFTAGRDVYFAQGKYAPASNDGRRLLAHEIAHVLQQTGRRLSTTLIQATERQGAGEIQRVSAAPPAFNAPARRYAADMRACCPAAIDPFADAAGDGPDGNTPDDEEARRHG
jgi:hypothetical protein